MKKIYYLLFFSSLASLAQTQIGTDINGEAANNLSGISVSLSSDGNIVAIGARYNNGSAVNSGHVRVYQNVSGVWTQIGADIDGEAFDDQSSTVSLSSNGNIVAIGAYQNDGNGSNSGHVRVYQNVSGVWTQIGADINGEAAGDQSGSSISLSDDGSILAIGAYANNGNGSLSGHVRVYQNISNVWTQIGADINGEAAGDQSGYSVSLSSDGSIVAIGARANSGNGSNSGHVRVYQNISNVWTQIGADIDGEAAGDFSGSAISLSSNGSIVAIGSNVNDGGSTDTGHVRVYQNISNVWTQIGADINGEASSDQSGFSVSLSSDGNILAIGAIANDGNGSNSGHVRIYQNISNVWTRIGSDINGEASDDLFGTSVSLSSNGNTVAIGGQSNDGNGTNSGHVRLFDLTAILASDSFVQSNFLLYPNPSKGIVNISLENNLQLEKVSIYNQLGQLVKTAESNVVYTTELAKGTYYLEVFTNQGKATKKIIVE